MLVVLIQPFCHHHYWKQTYISVTLVPLCGSIQDCKTVLNGEGEGYFCPKLYIQILEIKQGIKVWVGLLNSHSVTKAN